MHRCPGSEQSANDDRGGGASLGHSSPDSCALELSDD